MDRREERMGYGPPGGGRRWGSSAVATMLSLTLVSSVVALALVGGTVAPRLPDRRRGPLESSVEGRPVAGPFAAPQEQGPGQDASGLNIGTAADLLQSLGAGAASTAGPPPADEEFAQGTDQEADVEGTGPQAGQDEPGAPQGGSPPGGGGGEPEPGKPEPPPVREKDSSERDDPVAKPGAKADPVKVPDSKDEPDKGAEPPDGDPAPASTDQVEEAQSVPGDDEQHSPPEVPPVPVPDKPLEDEPAETEV